MQRFSLITETDARRLSPGDTVELLPGGHITPLAKDTLRDLRITVVRAGVLDADLATLAPPATIRTVAVGSDHTGLALKRGLIAWLRSRALSVIDAGTNSADPVDYPDIALAVAGPVARGEAEAGIVIDGAGLGSAIAANKVRGARAVMATTPTLARYGRQHNGANVLALGATLISEADARAIVETFLTTAMTEARYITRLAKVKQIEDNGGRS
jgi:ribose 5-phosphate isomerase B